MTEYELLRAVAHFSDLCRRDSDVAMMRTLIVSKGHESVGHFCRADPDGFVALYESALAMVGLDAEFDKYVEIRNAASEQ